MTSIDDMCGEDSKFTETQREIVEKFLSLLTGMTRECGVEIVDTGGFVFRMIDSKPFLTVSRDFLQNLGTHAIVLSMENPATSDCVAVLETSSTDVVKITVRGDSYSATTTPELINRQPLYIQQLLKRKTFSRNEYETLVAYLNTHSIKSELVDVPLEKPKPVDKPVVKPVSRPVVKSVTKEVKPLENSGSDAEDSEVGSKPSQPRVQIPSEDDESPKPEPEKRESPKQEKSQKLNVVFFKKNPDGSKDRTICKSGKYVYRMIQGDKIQLIGLGVYDSKTNGYTPLTKADKAEIVKLGFSV